MTSSVQPEKFNGKALLIGIDEYEHSLARNYGINHKVREIEKLLKSSQDGRYDPENVIRLLNQEANRNAILSVLESWKHEKNQMTTSLFYFSGYIFSKLFENKRQIYLCPYDTNPNDLIHTSILLVDFLRVLSKLLTQNLVVVLDIHHPSTIDDIDDIHQWKSSLPDIFRNTLGAKKKWVLLFSSPPQKMASSSSTGDMEHFSECFLEALSEKAAIREDRKIYIFDVFHYLSIEPKKHFTASIVSSPLEHNPPIGFVRKHQIPYLIKVFLNAIALIVLTFTFYSPAQYLTNQLRICVQPYVSALSLAIIVLTCFSVLYEFIGNRYFSEEASLHLGLFSFRMRVLALLNDYHIWHKKAWVSGGIVVILIISALLLGFTNFSPFIQFSPLIIRGFSIGDGQLYYDGGNIHLQERKPISIEAQTSDPGNTICRWSSESNPKIVSEICEYKYSIPVNIKQDTITLEASSSCGVRWSNARINISLDPVP